MSFIAAHGPWQLLQNNLFLFSKLSRKSWFYSPTDLSFSHTALTYLVPVLKPCRSLSLFAESFKFFVSDSPSYGPSLSNCIFNWPHTKAYSPHCLLTRGLSHWFLQPAPPHVILPFSEFPDSYLCMCYLVWLKSLGEMGALPFLLYFPIHCCDEECPLQRKHSSDYEIRPLSSPQYKSLTLSLIMLPLWQLNRIWKAQDCGFFKDRMSGSLEV